MLGCEHRSHWRMPGPHATLELEKNQLKDKERAIVCGHQMNSKLLLFGGCLAFASPLHLLSPPFAPEQVKLIHNHLYFLNRQIDIPEV